MRESEIKERNQRMTFKSRDRQPDERSKTHKSTPRQAEHTHTQEKVPGPPSSILLLARKLGGRLARPPAAATYTRARTRTSTGLLRTHARASNLVFDLDPRIRARAGAQRLNVDLGRCAAARAGRGGYLVALAQQLGIVQAAGVAERARAVGPAAPFGRLSNVARVALAGRVGALLTGADGRGAEEMIPMEGRGGAKRGAWRDGRSAAKEKKKKSGKREGK
jgi:hypothetical protein